MEMAMPRPLPQILAHIRAVAGNPSINTTLIQTEDLLALCDKVDEAERLRAALRQITEIEDEQYGSDWCEIEKAREIANAALSNEPDM
jgi:hypothetical protein